MTKVFDLKAETDKLTTLKGRTPQSTGEQRKDSSAQLAPYRDGQIFTSKFTGIGAWERHPKGDEYVQILEGATMLDLETAEGIQALSVKAGMAIVVPQNAWHRFRSTDGVTLLTITPLPTEHVRTDTDDPR
ncbi:MAG: cupin domain-containing protein [Alphaproteobacteria bacterium]|nr:cupin domain-containing protein [Alphaproteobacteria bacterium]